MMNERGRSRDLQHLSQYLDSRLNETQTRKLEARLAQDAALRGQLRIGGQTSVIAYTQAHGVLRSFGEAYIRLMSWLSYAY